jgi:hypothetical protein
MKLDELSKSQIVVKMNKRSEILVKQKLEKQKAKPESEEEYDLWPLMQKNYFEK